LSINPYIRLHSGRKFYFLDPKPNQIDITDVAISLSRLPRFCGHTSKPYFVGQHCCIACDLAPDNLKRAVLMHDMAESVTNDIPAPLKVCLPQFKEVENRVERMLAKKFRVPFPFPSGVKEIDLKMLTTEQRDLMPGDEWSFSPFLPYDIKIVPWDSRKTYREFLKRFHRLT
jgi:hypothetical protein